MPEWDWPARPASTPAAARLFKVDPDARKLSPKVREAFHHIIVQLLYLLKRARPDIQTAISFLCTRVQAPDIDDYNKLMHCLSEEDEGNVVNSWLRPANDVSTINWWVDALFRVDPPTYAATQTLPA